VLAALDLLDDDRTLAIDAWIDRKTAALPPGLQTDVGNWLRQLRHGHARARPRTDPTLYNYLGALTAVLHEWGARYAALREVTRDDVTAALAPLAGRPRGRLLTALRSLFGYLRRSRRVFHDPTTRLRQPKPVPETLLPLDSAAITAAVDRATTPTLRLILLLAAVHAGRPQAIRLLTLDDLDLANHRITLGGHHRRLDGATAALLREHLAERQARWPHTYNRHVLLSKQSALTDAPVSTYYFKQHFVAAGIRLDRIRLDRVLDEALTHGPDPLHLCAVFGLNEFAAIRIVELARRLDDPNGNPDGIGSRNARRYPCANSVRIGPP
jgi:site-specific recombinase XerD